MADKKISLLNAAPTIFDADDFAVVQDGETKQTNASVVKTYVKDGLSKSDVGLGNVDNTSDATKNSATVTLTNKTISGSSNTLSDIGNSSLTNSSITINGNVVSLGGSTTVTATASNALTLGTGLTGTSYNGSSAVTAAIDTSVVTTLTGTQTLTNKTLTSPVINGFTGTGNGSLAGALSLTGASGNLSYAGTLTGGTGVINIGSGQLYKDSSGNVGIGTSSPGAKLDVYNSAAPSNNGEIARLRWNTVGGVTGNGGVLNFANHNGTIIGRIANSIDAGGAGFGLRFWTFSNGIGFGERLLISSSGVVTIGSAISLDPTTANALVVNSSGNVGLGVSSPGSPLDIRCDASAFGIALRGRPSDNISVLRFLNNAASSTYFQFDIRSDGALFNSVANSPILLLTNNTERARITAAGNVLVTGGGGLGYGTGSGGAVTQATSKSTAVTLNKPSGEITMNGGQLAAGATAGFTLTNSLITLDDIVNICMDGFSGNSQSYHIWTAPIPGGCYVFVKNISAVNLSEAIRLKFAVIKVATS